MGSILDWARFVLFQGGASVLFLVIGTFTTWGIRARDFVGEPDERRYPNDPTFIGMQTGTTLATTTILVGAMSVSDPIGRPIIIAGYLAITWFLAVNRRDSINAVRADRRKGPLPNIAIFAMDIINTGTSTACLLAGVYITFNFLGGLSAFAPISQLLSEQEGVKATREGLYAMFQDKLWSSFMFAHFAICAAAQYFRFLVEQYEDNGGISAAMGAAVLYPASVAALIAMPLGNIWISILALLIFVGIWSLYAGYFFWGNPWETYDTLQENHFLLGPCMMVYLFGSDRVTAETFYQYITAIYRTWTGG